MLTEQQKAFEKILDLVDESGCMPYVVLVGSWAEFAYAQAGLLPGFASSIKTLDVDFLIRNLRKPTPPVNLSSFARGRGYFIESDRLNGTTKIFDSAGLEVEFLIRKMGAGVDLLSKPISVSLLKHSGIWIFF